MRPREPLGFEDLSLSISVVTSYFSSCFFRINIPYQIFYSQIIDHIYKIGYNAGDIILPTNTDIAYTSIPGGGEVYLLNISRYDNITLHAQYTSILTY